jgi:hypothetical protein
MKRPTGRMGRIERDLYMAFCVLLSTLCFVAAFKEWT